MNSKKKYEFNISSYLQNQFIKLKTDDEKMKRSEIKRVDSKWTLKNERNDYLDFLNDFIKREQQLLDELLDKTMEQNALYKKPKSTFEIYKNVKNKQQLIYSSMLNKIKTKMNYGILDDSKIRDAVNYHVSRIKSSKKSIYNCETIPITMRCCSCYSVAPSKSHDVVINQTFEPIYIQPHKRQFVPFGTILKRPHNPASRSKSECQVWSKRISLNSDNSDISKN